MKTTTKLALAIVLTLLASAYITRKYIQLLHAKEQTSFMTELLAEINPVIINDIIKKRATIIDDAELAKELAIPNGRLPSNVYTHKSMVICIYDSPPFFQLDKLEFRKITNK